MRYGISNSSIRELYNSGMKLEEIGKIAGLSRQRIHQIVKSKEKILSDFQISLIDGVKYAGIRNFILREEMSLTDFCKEVKGKNHEQTTVSFLRGKTKGDIKLITEILKYTGLSFEEAFKEELN